MNKTLFFNMSKSNKTSKEIIKHLNLKKILENDRTKIFQNNEMRLCIDNNVIRILVYDKDNTILLEQLKRYFYGEEYERLFM